MSHESASRSDYKPQSFWKLASSRILRAAIIAGLAVFADHLLERTAWYQHFQEAGYKSAQYALMQHYSPPEEGLPVRMLDLSTLIQRKQAPLICGRRDDDDQLEMQWSALIPIVEDIRKAGPKALLVDWELALPDSCVEVTDKGRLKIKDSVQEGARVAYRDLMQKLTEADKQFPVLIVSENAGARLQKHAPLFPEPSPSHLACGPVLLRTPHLIYMAQASHQGVMGLAAAPDAVVQRVQGSTLRESKRPKAHSTEEGHKEAGFINPFEVTVHHEKTGEPAYWIDYAYLPCLLRETVSVEPVNLAKSAVQAQLRDRVVVLADVTDPYFEDVFPLPLEWEKASIRSAWGERKLPAYTGGLGHACAILTRMNRPLYSVREGWVWLGTLFVFNLLFLLLGLVVSMVIGGFRDHSDRAELKQIMADLSMVLLSAAFLVWLNVQSWWTRLLLPQYAPLMVARMLELIAVIFLVGLHLKRHKPHGENPAARQAEKPEQEVAA